MMIGPNHNDDNVGWNFHLKRDFLLTKCPSEDTLKTVGPFHLVSIPGEVKDPTSPHWNV